MKKKVALVTCFIGLLGGVTALAVDGMRLRGKLEYLEDIVEEYESDQEIDELITNQIILDVKREESVKEIKKITSDFAEALFSAPSDPTYGQVPYVQKYLTDAGIKNFIKTMNPERFDEVTSEQINEIRSMETQPDTDHSQLQVISRDTCVEIDNDVTMATVSYKAECNYDQEKSLPTCIISMTFRFIEDQHSQWKIDDVTDFCQI